MEPMKTQRQRDLAKIHIAKKQLGLDEDTYRTMLQQVAGVGSAADLDAGMRLRVLDHLHKAGFKSKLRKRYPGRPKNMDDIDKGRLLRKIEALLAEANRPWNYAHGMAKRMFSIERVQWCEAFQLHKIVAALMYDARRHGRYTGS